MPLPIPRLAPVTTATLPTRDGRLLMILMSKFSDVAASLSENRELKPLLNALAHGQSALQRKTRNRIFTHKCDAGMGLSVDNELFEHLGTRWATGDAIVRAHRHHATPRSSLGIERVELSLEIIGIHGRVEVPSFIVHDVVHV